MLEVIDETNYVCMKLVQADPMHYGVIYSRALLKWGTRENLRWGMNNND